jgi:hypothetical protein
VEERLPREHEALSSKPQYHKKKKKKKTVKTKEKKASSWPGGTEEHGTY